MSYQDCPFCGQTYNPYEGECESCMKDNYFNGKLKHAARVKRYFQGADFWIIRKGGVSRVGEPTHEYSPEHIGIKANEKFDPSFLFYVVKFLHGQGAFKPLAMGATDLQHIRVEDVKKLNILNGLSFLSQRSSK